MEEREGELLEALFRRPCVYLSRREARRTSHVPLLGHVSAQLASRNARGEYVNGTFLNSSLHAGTPKEMSRSRIKSR